jgi:quercetin dioxygenase-like cupin family protein
MALVHAHPLDVIDVRPLGQRLAEAKTHSLLKTTQLQLMRLVLPAGVRVPQHHVVGEITLHCLEGTVLVHTPGRLNTLHAGELMALRGEEPHALEARSDASLLVTILLRPPAEASH